MAFRLLLKAANVTVSPVLLPLSVTLFPAVWTIAPEPLVPDLSMPLNSATDHSHTFCVTPAKSIVNAPEPGEEDKALNKVILLELPG